MNRLYNNIGNKIKTLAKSVFIVEAIGGVALGIALFLDYEIVPGIIIIITSPIIAFVSSWILYGLGELIEKTSMNEENTRAILQLLQQKND